LAVQTKKHYTHCSKFRPNLLFALVRGAFLLLAQLRRGPSFSSFPPSAACTACGAVASSLEEDTPARLPSVRRLRLQKMKVSVLLKGHKGNGPLVKGPLEKRTVVAALKQFEVNEQNRVAAMSNRGGTLTNLFCTATYSRSVLEFDGWPAGVKERCRVHAVILMGYRKDALHCVCVTVNFASHWIQVRDPNKYSSKFHEDGGACVMDAVEEHINNERLSLGFDPIAFSKRCYSYNIPKQDNYDDCGVHCLHCIDSLCNRCKIKKATLTDLEVRKCRERLCSLLQRSRGVPSVVVIDD
jgi:hypothetical protein